MLIACKSCGAPLDVQAGQELVKCRYCASQHRVAESKSLGETPGNWKAPAQWNDKQAGSTKLVLAITLASTLVVGGISFALATSRSGSGTSAISRRVGLPAAETIGKIRPSMKPAAVDAAIEGVSLGGGVGLVGSRFTRLQVGFDSRRERVTSMGVYRSEPDGDAEALSRELAAVFGAGWQTKKSSQGTGFAFGSWVTFGSEGKSLALHLTFDADKQGEQAAHLDALWKVISAVALSRPVQLTERERALVRGYTPARVAELPFDLQVEAAQQRILDAFPGTVAEVGADLDVQLRLDHPWYKTLQLQWRNSAQAQILRANFRGVGPSQEVPVAELEVVRCLEPVLGKAEERVTNHLKQIKQYHWPLGEERGAQARLWERGLGFTFAKGSDRTVLKSVLAALERCASNAK